MIVFRSQLVRGGMRLDAARAVDRGIGNIGNTIFALPQVKSHIIDIGRRQYRCRWKHDGLYYLIRCQVDSDELCPTRDGRREPRCGGVKYPKPIGSVDDNALYASQSLAGL